MITKKYKEIPAREDMIVNQIYIRIDEDNCWEVKAKDKEDTVWAMRTEYKDEITDCVLAVYNSIKHPRLRDNAIKKQSHA